MENNYEYLGHGIYSIHEASQLTKIKKNKIKRWITGYSYKRKSLTKAVDPIFTKDYEDIFLLSFLDLIELLFINAFTEHDISLQTIRIASENAAKLLHCSHPFSMKKLYTDKKDILIKIAKQNGDSKLLNLVDNQFEMEEMLKSCLYECLDFTDNEIAYRWWPLGKNHPIIIDPKRNFGKPIITEYNIPTKTIYSAYTTVQSIDIVAEWYEIDKKYVQEAIAFEKSLAA